MENSRLQAQLKSGFDAFNDFKAKKAEEAKEMQEKMGQLEEKVNTLATPPRSFLFLSPLTDVLLAFWERGEGDKGRQSIIPSSLIL